MNSIRDWKQYLTSIGLYNNTIDNQVDLSFKKSMVILDNFICKCVPSARGYIWSDNCVKTSISDVKRSLEILNKYGQATLDALGDPTASDFIAPSFNAMIISQEDSKLDEWDPKNHQNQGKQQQAIPKKTEDNSIKPKNNNIDDRMSELIKMLETTKK